MDELKGNEEPAIIYKKSPIPFRHLEEPRGQRNRRLKKERQDYQKLKHSGYQITYEHLNFYVAVKAAPGWRRF